MKRRNFLKRLGIVVAGVPFAATLRPAKASLPVLVGGDYINGTCDEIDPPSLGLPTTFNALYKQTAFLRNCFARYRRWRWFYCEGTEGCTLPSKVDVISDLRRGMTKLEYDTYKMCVPLGSKITLCANGWIVIGNGPDKWVWKPTPTTLTMGVEILPDTHPHRVHCEYTLEYAYHVSSCDWEDVSNILTKHPEIELCVIGKEMKWLQGQFPSKIVTCEWISTPNNIDSIGIDKENWHVEALRSHWHHFPEARAFHDIAECLAYREALDYDQQVINAAEAENAIHPHMLLQMAHIHKIRPGNIKTWMRETRVKYPSLCRT